MGKNETARTWVAVVIIIVAASMFTVLWSGLSGMIGAPGTSIEAEPVHVTIPLPNGEALSISSIQLFAGLGVLIVGLVVITGVVIGFVNLFLSRQVQQITESEQFQQHQTALASKEKEMLSQRRTGRAADSEQQHDYKQWAVWGTTLTILMFVIFLAFMISTAFVPTSEVIRDGQIVNVTAVVVGISSLLALLISGWRLRSQKLAAIDETDNDKAPWDFMWVVLSGLLVLGLGTGLMLYLIGQA